MSTDLDFMFDQTRERLEDLRRAIKELDDKTVTGDYMCIIENGEVSCSCPNFVLNDYKFNHQPAELIPGVGNNFDDFGYAIYVDSKGEKHKTYFHQHVGVVHSYEHSYEEKQNDWKLDVKVFDNSVLPEIKKRLEGFKN